MSDDTSTPTTPDPDLMRLFQDGQKAASLETFKRPLLDRFAAWVAIRALHWLYDDVPPDPYFLELRDASRKLTADMRRTINGN